MGYAEKGNTPVIMLRHCPEEPDGSPNGLAAREGLFWGGRGHGNAPGKVLGNLRRGSTPGLTRLSTKILYFKI
jgi:hypothetical protein